MGLAKARSRRDIDHHHDVDGGLRVDAVDLPRRAPAIVLGLVCATGEGVNKPWRCATTAAFATTAFSSAVVRLRPSRVRRAVPAQRHRAYRA